MPLSYYITKDELLPFIPFHSIPILTITNSRFKQPLKDYLTEKDKKQLRLISEIRKTGKYDFGKLCAKGQLDVIRWLHTTVDDVRSVNNYAFISSCGNGYLEVLRWLHSTFNLTDDVRSENNWAFRYSCANSQLDVAKWLTETFGIA